jgi:heme exporter protein D
MYDQLHGFFRWRAVGATLRRLKLLWRHPTLVRIALTRAFHRRRVAEEPT